MEKLKYPRVDSLKDTITTTKLHCIIQGQMPKAASLNSLGVFPVNFLKAVL